MISVNGLSKHESLLQYDAARLHETELFCHINEDLSRISRSDIILITNCPEELATDICKWSCHRDAIAHYCKKNQAVAVSRY